MIDVVAFDLDDTLWEESKAQAAAVARLHAEWRVDAPLDQFVEVWREASSRLFDAYVAGRMSHTEQRFARIRELLLAFDLPATDDQVEKWTARYVDLYQSGWQPVGDAIAVLGALHDLGVGLAVVTNGDGEMQRAKLVRMRLLPRFDWVLISGEVGAAKPDPVIFRRLIELSGAAPERILFVGDRLDKDVLPARRMGMMAVHMDHDKKARGADVAHALSQVLERVARARGADVLAGGAPVPAAATE